MCLRGSSAPTVRGARCRRWWASTPTVASRSSRWTGHARMARHPASPMASPPKEREVKLGAGPAFHLPSLDGVVEGAIVQSPEVLRLETVYHDTPDLRLARWGVSLRHRGGEGWTLKLPSAAGAAPNGGVARDEIEFEGRRGRVPEAALKLLAAYVRRSQLEPVARLKTKR